MKDTENTSCLETLPFPVILRVETGEIVYRNRLAKRLLPAPSKLKRIVGQKSFPCKENFSQVCIEDVLYFVGTLSFGEKDMIFFLENFLPFYEPLSRAVLAETDSLLWKALPFGEEAKSITPAFLDSFAARTYRLRRIERDYLRLLQVKNRPFDNAVSCSLQGFFRHLSQNLIKRGIVLESDCPDEAAVHVDPSELTFLILNFVHFAYLFEGENKIFVSVEKEAKGFRLSLQVSASTEFIPLMQDLLFGKEKGLSSLLCLPFLSVASVCQKEGFLWLVQSKEGKTEVSFLLPASDFMPTAFLSDATAKEVQELLRMEKEYFS
ncbi:MAG: hypothetical protein IKU24_03785 [Clostridia bacterium]|nr:hypothetical protein [Clostridia bacterium]